MGLTNTELKNMLGRVSDEVWDKGHFDVVNEMFSPDLIDHNPLPGLTPGREGYKQAAIAIRTAFPDLKIKMLHQLAQGDMGLDHWEGTGTHLGELMGIPATGKQIWMAGLNLGRINDEGQIVERWAQFNSLDLMQQIGAIPGGGSKPPQPPLPNIIRNDSPSREENIAIARRYVNKLWNAGDLAVADELIHSAGAMPYMPELPVGPGGISAYVTMFRQALPNMETTIEHMIADDDLVGIFARTTGTHQGEFLGLPPSNKLVNFESLAILQMVNGQIVVNWEIADLLALFQQIQPPMN